MGWAENFMHRLTAEIARRLKESRAGAILEKLKGIKYRILNGSKRQNRKLSTWDSRIFQRMLEYKPKWLGLPVKYVDPRSTSKTCPLCSGSLASYEGGLMKCRECSRIIDRDIAAVLNLQMRGAVFPRRALDEIIEREELRTSIKTT